MRYYIGIDLGGTNIAAGLVGEDARLLAKYSIPTGAERPADELIADMAEAARRAAEAAGVSMAEVEAVGVGIPGACDLTDMSVMLAVNLNWKNVPLGKKLGALLGKPVLLGNDADCAALGEALAGCAREYDSAVMITIGTGIGGGIILNNRIFAGGTRCGTEPGHIPLVFGGEKCGCGKSGCFEAYASCTALIRQTRRAMEKNPSSALWQFCGGDLNRVDGRTPFDGAAAGDETARQVIDQYISYLAGGISALINVFRPQAVILGGGVSNQGDNLIRPLAEEVRKYVYGADIIEPPVIRRAILGNDAGIIGAALIGK